MAAARACCCSGRSKGKLSLLPPEPAAARPSLRPPPRPPRGHSAAPAQSPAATPQFKATTASMMACFFAITTTSGIGAGAGLSSFYNPNSSRALVVEGLLDSVSAGILIYMALVDLIAADFLSRSTSCSTRLQVLSYLALFFDTASMLLLALWA